MPLLTGAFGPLGLVQGIPAEIIIEEYLRPTAGEGYSGGKDGGDQNRKERRFHTVSS